MVTRAAASDGYTFAYWPPNGTARLTRIDVTDAMDILLRSGIEIGVAIVILSVVDVGNLARVTENTWMWRDCGAADDE